MRMLALKCESCGAPLDLPADFAEAQCTYCDSRIWIERSVPRQSPGPPPPAPIDHESREIKEQIAQLDREWETYRGKYLDRDEQGQYDIPVEEHCRMGMWATAVLGAIVILGAVVVRPPFALVPFAIVVLVVVGATLIGLRRQMNIARVYARSKRNYDQERRRLIEALPSP